MSVAMLAVIMVVATLFALYVVGKGIVVCSPNELLVISGRRHRASDGSVVGYRTLRGGRAVVIPVLENVDRLDLSNMLIRIELPDARFSGRRRVPITLVANVKIDPNEPRVRNAVERFLGKPREEIAATAQQTLEGIARHVLVNYTTDEASYDREKLANVIIEEAEHDLSKLGFLLDTLKVQHVGDDVATYR